MGAYDFKIIEQVGSVEQPALGFIELDSIARGLFLTDQILKKAPVRMIASHPISSGKHVLLFTGDVASADESYRTALEQGVGSVLKSVLIPAVHPGIAKFLESLWKGQPGGQQVVLEEDSVGILESSTLAGALLAADRALKSAEVYLVRMRLGQGIGGKAYFVIAGPQEEVEASVEAGASVLHDLGSFVRTDLIARPGAEAVAFF